MQSAFACPEQSVPGLWVYGLPPEGFLKGPLGAALHFSISPVLQAELPCFRHSDPFVPLEGVSETGVGAQLHHGAAVPLQ